MMPDKDVYAVKLEHTSEFKEIITMLVRHGYFVYTLNNGNIVCLLIGDEECKPENIGEYSLCKTIKFYKKDEE